MAGIEVVLTFFLRMRLDLSAQGQLRFTEKYKKKGNRSQVQGSTFRVKDKEAIKDLKSC